MSAKDLDADQENRSGAGLTAVGARLREAREKQQLKLETIATDLHLRPEIVQALETGDEAKLPGAAFVRGYVRSYARRLGLDDTELTAQMPEAFETRATPLKTVGTSRRHAAFPLGKWIVWLLLLSAVVVFVTYGVPVLERLWSSTPVQEDGDRLEIPQVAPDFSSEAEPVPYEDVIVAEELVSEEAAPEESAVVEGMEAEDVLAEETQPAEERIPVTAEPREEVVETETGAGIEAPEALLQLRFREDSWVELEADGRKLIVGIQRAGSERTVRAQPPIQLLLGNAAGVDLIYKGVEVDTQPYRRGRVARIVLED